MSVHPRFFSGSRVIGERCICADECVIGKACTEAEAHDEAVEVGFAVDLVPCVNIVEKTMVSLSLFDI